LILAAILPAASTALTAYIALYDPEKQSSIYRDAGRAVRAAASFAQNPDGSQESHLPEQETTELVKRVESALLQEHSQWGQLTSQVLITDRTKD
jgi:hypothetical protein